MKLLHFLSEVLRMLTMASFSAHCLGWSTGLSLSEKVRSFDSFKIAMSLSPEGELGSNFGCLWTAEARTKDEVALQWSCSPNSTRNLDPPFRVIRSLPAAIVAAIVSHRLLSLLLSLPAGQYEQVSHRRSCKGSRCKREKSKKSHHCGGWWTGGQWLSLSPH